MIAADNVNIYNDAYLYLGKENVIATDGEPLHIALNWVTPNVLRKVFVDNYLLSK